MYTTSLHLIITFHLIKDSHLSSIIYHHFRETIYLTRKSDPRILFLFISILSSLFSNSSSPLPSLPPSPSGNKRQTCEPGKRHHRSLAISGFVSTTSSSSEDVSRGPDEKSDSTLKESSARIMSIRSVDGESSLFHLSTNSPRRIPR